MNPLRAARRSFSDTELASNCLMTFIAFGVRYLRKKLLGAHDSLHCDSNDYRWSFEANYFGFP
jgi:hypothetical protein